MPSKHIKTPNPVARLEHPKMLHTDQSRFGVLVDALRHVKWYLASMFQVLNLGSSEFEKTHSKSFQLATGKDIKKCGSALKVFFLGGGVNLGGFWTPPVHDYLMSFHDFLMSFHDFLMSFHGLSTVMCVPVFFLIFCLLLSGFFQRSGENPLCCKFMNSMVHLWRHCVAWSQV